MARKCSICTHNKRREIDQAIIAGQSYRDIAGRFGLSKSAVERHAKAHLPATLVKAQEVEEVAQAGALLAQVQELRDRAFKILDRAERSQDLRAALQALREARGCVELLAKLAGETSEAPQVNLLLSPQWVELRKTILLALEPYPEARARVAEVLNHAGG